VLAMLQSLKDRRQNITQKQRKTTTGGTISNNQKQKLKK
jgi:hypothetical protein